MDAEQNVTIYAMGWNSAREQTREIMATSVRSRDIPGYNFITVGKVLQIVFASQTLAENRFVSIFFLRILL